MDDEQGYIEVDIRYGDDRFTIRYDEDNDRWLIHKNGVYFDWEENIPDAAQSILDHMEGITF